MTPPGAIFADSSLSLHGPIASPRAAAARRIVKTPMLAFLPTSFKGRFEREQRAVATLQGRLSAGQASHAWAAGELLSQLVERLDQQVALCQRRERFSALALTLVKAHEYWCHQMEVVLGRIWWGQVSPESRRAFEAIAAQEGSALGGRAG